LRPTHIFTPFVRDLHADHRALSEILGAALAAAPLEPQILQYEVWGVVPPNLYCDVTAEAARVERLLFLYERAMEVEDFVHFCERRNLARALELTGRAGYVEAFLATGGAEYRKMLERPAER
jgi:LmbE family N-acetylglucosaminyl deacetylase